MVRTRFLLLVLVTILCLCYGAWLYFGSPPSSPKAIASSEVQKPKLATQPQSKPPSKRAPQKDRGDDDFIDELLAYASPDPTHETLLFAGSEIMHVRGASIVRDDDTGIVSVRGLKQVELSNWVFDTSDDGVLTFDPTTGKTNVIASSIQQRPSVKDPK